MEELLEKGIDGLNLDRSDWQLVKFGDVAIQQKQTVDRENTDLTRYVKGEHMHSEDIHLREWGELQDEYLGPAFIRKFEEGDILYGSRRTYLRKVVIAPFDGITSNTTFVIKAKNKRIDKRLLPFIMLSEGFSQHSIRNSKGSVNPYVNWKDLAGYEFLLPSFDHQTVLVDLLTSLDTSLQSDKALLSKAQKFEKSEEKSIFLSSKPTDSIKTPLGRINKNWQCLTLENLIKEKFIVSHLDGNHGSFYPTNDEFVEKGVPYISANCIEDDRISFSKAKYLTQERASVFKKGVAINGDVLLAHNATVGPVCILETDLPKVILSTTLTYFRVNPDKMDRDYLYHFMASRLFQSQLHRVMTQSTRNQVPITTQRKLYFLVPTISEQRKATIELKKAVLLRKKVERKIDIYKLLQKSIINQVF